MDLLKSDSIYKFFNQQAGKKKAVSELKQPFKFYSGSLIDPGHILQIQ